MTREKTEYGKSESVSLSDLLLNPRNISETLKKSESSFIPRSLAMLVIFSSIIGAIYGAIFSGDKLFILQNAYKVPIINFCAVLFAFPLLAVFLRLFGARALLLAKFPFRKTLSILAISLTYAPIILLITAPAYILTAYNNQGAGKFVFAVILILSGIVSFAMLAYYLSQVFEMPYRLTIPVAIITAFYIVLLFVNMAAIAAPFSAYQHYYPLLSPAMEALTVV